MLRRHSRSYSCRARCCSGWASRMRWQPLARAQVWGGQPWQASQPALRWWRWRWALRHTTSVCATSRSGRSGRSCAPLGPGWQALIGSTLRGPSVPLSGTRLKWGCCNAGRSTCLSMGRRTHRSRRSRPPALHEPDALPAAGLGVRPRHLSPAVLHAGRCWFRALLHCMSPSRHTPGQPGLSPLSSLQPSLLGHAVLQLGHSLSACMARPPADFLDACLDVEEGSIAAGRQQGIQCV